MTEVVTEWICDACGTPIRTVEEGWVEWARIRNTDTGALGRSTGLRLVHNRRECSYEVNDMLDEGLTFQHHHLERFYGPEGRERVLDAVTRGVVDKDEADELLRRLNEPGYEQSRERPQPL